MSIISRIFMFLVFEGLGYLLLTRTLPFVNIVGKLESVEESLGPGRTYLVWKLVGVALMFVGLLVLLGKLVLW